MSEDKKQEDLPMTNTHNDQSDIVRVGKLLLESLISKSEESWSVFSLDELLDGKILPLHQRRSEHE